MAEEYRSRGAQGRDFDRGPPPFAKRHRFEGDDRRGPGRFDSRGPRGAEGQVLDEDLQFCPSYDNWRNRSSENSSVEKYCEFVKQWLQDRDDTFGRRHWREDWFLERYEPLRASERLQERRAGVLQRSKELAPSLFVSLAQSSQEPNKLIAGPEPYQLSEATCAYLPHVPPLLPRVVLEKTLQAEGAHVILLSEVNRSKKRKDLGRRGTIVFSNVQLARDCINKGFVSCWVAVDSDGVNAETSSAKDEHRNEITVKVLPFKVLPNRVLPAEVLTPERQDRDEHQALQCAEVLDQVFNVEADFGVHTAISKRPQNVSKLDATIQYLRYVHLYCYYSGALCRDYGELVHKSASPFVRPADNQAQSASADEAGARGAEAPSAAAATRDFENDPRRFLENVDQTCEKIVSEFAPLFEAETRLIEESVARRNQLFDEAFERYVSENISMKNTHVYCQLHDKLFQNETFYRKHLTNFHGSALRSIQRKAIMDLIWSRYNQDEDKPVPRPQRFVDDVLRGKFVPFESSRSSSDFPRRQPEHPRSSEWSRSSDQQQQPPAASEPQSRRYRDPDAPNPDPAAAAKPQKLHYRTRVSYAG